MEKLNNSKKIKSKKNIKIGAKKIFTILNIFFVNKIIRKKNFF